MPRSQNGYSANDRSVIQTYTVGNGRRVALRKGSPGFLLVHFANWFDKNVQDIDSGQLDDWGYAERAIRGGTELSNHASGTAIDINATRWPLGSNPLVNLSQAAIDRIRRQLRVYEGCIRWGGDYRGRLDPMHFEIVLNEDTCDRVARKLQGITTPATSRPVLKLGSIGNAVTNLQRDLAARFPAYRHEHGALSISGRFDPTTVEWVKEFQRRSGITADGIVGPITYRALGWE